MMNDMSQSNQNFQDTLEELYAVVIGRVQGVGFRYFVVREAQTLGLHGYTRNDDNGDVEIVAQGTRSALEHLLVLLRQGPPAAQVYEIQTTWRERTEHVSGFHIRW
jgi:acylphosphatase